MAGLRSGGFSLGRGDASRSGEICAQGLLVLAGRGGAGGDLAFGQTPEGPQGDLGTLEGALSDRGIRLACAFEALTEIVEHLGFALEHVNQVGLVFLGDEFTLGQEDDQVGNL